MIERKTTNTELYIPSHNKVAKHSNTNNCSLNSTSMDAWRTKHRKKLHISTQVEPFQDFTIAEKLWRNSKLRHYSKLDWRKFENAVSPWFLHTFSPFPRILSAEINSSYFIQTRRKDEKKKRRMKKNTQNKRPLRQSKSGKLKCFLLIHFVKRFQQFTKNEKYHTGPLTCCWSTLRSQFTMYS